MAVALTSFLVGNCTARVLNIGDKVNGLYPPHEELSSMSYPYIVGAPKSKGKKGKSKKGKSKSSKGKGKREKGKGKWHTKAPTVKMPKGKGKGIFLPTPLVSTTPDMVPTYSPGATMKPTPESGTEPPDETEEPTTAPVPRKCCMRFLERRSGVEVINAYPWLQTMQLPYLPSMSSLLRTN